MFFVFHKEFRLLPFNLLMRHQLKKKKKKSPSQSWRGISYWTPEQLDHGGGGAAPGPALWKSHSLQTQRVPLGFGPVFEILRGPRGEERSIVPRSIEKVARWPFLLPSHPAGEVMGSRCGEIMGIGGMESCPQTTGRPPPRTDVQCLARKPEPRVPEGAGPFPPPHPVTPSRWRETEPQRVDFSRGGQATGAQVPGANRPCPSGRHMQAQQRTTSAVRWTFFVFPTRPFFSFLKIFF